MLSKLNYCWRIVGTGISFLVFGLGGLVLSLTIFPYLNWRYKDQETRKRKGRYLIHRCFKLFVSMMQNLQIFTFHLEEAREALKNTEGKIVIANHPSLIDVVVLISILPQADCIVKKALWNNFFLKRVVSAADYIQNDNDVDNLMDACNRSLDEGYCLIIFPEGTRTTPNAELRLQRGASNIAIRCRRQFVPVTISCNPTTLTKNEKWYQIPDRRVDFSLRVGSDIDTSEYYSGEQSPSLAARKLTQVIKQYFEQEKEQGAKS